MNEWRADADRLAAIVRRSRSQNANDWTGLREDAADALARHDALAARTIDVNIATSPTPTFADGYAAGLADGSRRRR